MTVESIESVRTVNWEPRHRAVWTPGRSFFKRLKKDQLLAIHAQIMDRPAPGQTLAKQSKAAVVDWLHLIFQGGKGAPTLTEAQQARVTS